VLDDLSFIDLEQIALKTFDNPFGPRLSPMSQVRFVAHVAGKDRDGLAAPSAQGQLVSDWVGKAIWASSR
jgi:hypothetical protein